MQDPKTFSFPFILRDMLRFEQSTRFELIATTRSLGTSTINIVGATREGIFKYSVTLTNTADTAQITRFNIPDLPIWISVIDKNGTIPLGEVYVKVDVAINSDTMHTLCSGYVYNTKSIGWPYVNLETAEGHKGTIGTVTSADPAAGAEVSITVPLGEEWRIISITFSLVTSAAVAGRLVHLSAEVNGAPVFDFISGDTQPASTTKTYFWESLSGIYSTSDSGKTLVPIPENMIIPGGDVIRTVTTLLQAGDNFGTMIINRERFIKLTPN